MSGVVDFDVALKAAQMGVDPQTLVQQTAAETPQVTPQVAPQVAQQVPPQAAPADTPAATPPAAPPADAPPPVPTFDFSKFGVQSEEELSTRLKEREELQSKFGELQERVKPLLETLPYLEDPFADPSIKKVNEFVRKTGIKDLGFAAQVVSMDEAQVKADPLRAIAIAEALSDPNLASLGIDKLYKKAARDHGITPGTPMDEWPDEAKESLEIAAFKSLKTISQKKSEWENTTDFFASSQEKSRQAKEAAEKNAQEWQRVLPTVTTAINEIVAEEEIEGLGKITAKVALSQTEINNVVQQIMPTLARMAPDVNGQQYVRDVVLNAMRSAKATELMKAGIKAYHEQYAASIEQKVRQAQVNGGPVGGTPPPPSGTPDDTMKFLSGRFAPRPRD